MLARAEQYHYKNIKNHYKLKKPKKRSQEDLIEEILSTVRIIANQNPNEELN
jgi:hypothetical protein